MIVLLILFLIAVVPCLAASQKSTLPNVIFILDASGSIWGQTD